MRLLCLHVGHAAVAVAVLVAVRAAARRLKLLGRWVLQHELHQARVILGERLGGHRTAETVLGQDIDVLIGLEQRPRGFILSLLDGPVQWIVARGVWFVRGAGSGEQLDDRHVAVRARLVQRRVAAVVCKVDGHTLVQ